MAAFQGEGFGYTREKGRIMHYVKAAGIHFFCERFQVQFSVFLHVHGVIKALRIHGNDAQAVLPVLFLGIYLQVFLEPQLFYLFRILGKFSGDIAPGNLFQGKLLPVPQACRLQTGFGNTFSAQFFQDVRFEPKTAAVAHLTATLQRLKRLDRIFRIPQVPKIQAAPLQETGIAVMVFNGVVQSLSNLPVKRFLLFLRQCQESVLLHPGLEAAAVYSPFLGAFFRHLAGAVPVSRRFVEHSQRVIALIVSAVYTYLKSLFCRLRVRIFQRQAQQIIVERVAVRVFLYVLLEDIGHHGRVLGESVVSVNGVFQRHGLGQFAARLVGGIHEEGMHPGIGFVGLCAAVKVQLGQGGVCVLNTMGSGIEKKGFRLFETRSARVHHGQPSAITIGGIRVCLAVCLEFFHHFRGKAFDAPAGKEMLQEIAVRGDVEGLCHDVHK